MDWKVFQIYFDLKTIENLNLIIGKNFNQNIINKEIKDWKTHQNWGKIFKQNSNQLKQMTRKWFKSSIYKLFIVKWDLKLNWSQILKQFVIEVIGREYKLSKVNWYVSKHLH